MTSRPMQAGVDLVVTGGRVVCGVTGRDEPGDVLVSGGRIAGVVAPGSEPPQGARVVDAAGCLVMPGMIDLGVHFRDPGREQDEDLAGTLLSALRGGVTTLVALPDTDPPVDGSDDVLHRRAAVSRALGDARAPSVLVAGALTRGRKGKEPADVADMAAAGVTVFSDAAYVDDADVLRRALEYARGAGARLALLHGPARDLAAGGVVVEGAVSTRLGLPGVPELADALAVVRHAGIARLAGIHAHLGPIFSAGALDALVQIATRPAASTSAAEGPPRVAVPAPDAHPELSAEVHPWHLLLDERAHFERRYDALLRLDPPLPTAASRTALLDGVKRGILAISSGHRAVPNRTKDLEFAVAEAGASALALTLALLVDVLTPLELARATSALPARILELRDRGRIVEGARADLVVLRRLESDGDVVDAALTGARSPASPWLGRRLRGRVEVTLVNGRVAHERRSPA